MRYVKVAGKGQQKVHVQQKHSSYSLCGEVSTDSELRTVEGPATCVWCVDSLDDLLDAVVVESGGESVLEPEEVAV